MLLLFLIKPHLEKFSLSTQCIPNLYLETNLPVPTQTIVLENNRYVGGQRYHLFVTKVAKW